MDLGRLNPKEKPQDSCSPNMQGQQKVPLICDMLVTLWANFKGGSHVVPSPNMEAKFQLLSLTKPFKYGQSSKKKSDLDYFEQIYSQICVEKSGLAFFTQPNSQHKSQAPPLRSVVM